MNESRYFLGVFNAMLRSESALAADATVASIDHFDDSEWRSDGNTIEARPVPVGGHRLPPLPYAYDALEPYIDEKTMRLHHEKHHASYVEGLNEAEKMMRTARETGDFALETLGTGSGVPRRGPLLAYDFLVHHGAGRRRKTGR